MLTACAARSAELCLALETFGMLESMFDSMLQCALAWTDLQIPTHNTTTDWTSHLDSAGTNTSIPRGVPLTATPPQNHAVNLQELRRSCAEAGDDHFAGVAEAVRAGLRRVPCDIVHDASTGADAVRRLRANLPPVTAFEALEGCRRDLDVFEQQLQCVEGVSRGSPGRSCVDEKDAYEGDDASPESMMT